jgi:hypothetical protein
VQEIVELTPEHHPDHANLTASLQLIREAEIHANNRAQQRKNIDKVIAIQNSISGAVRNSSVMKVIRFL